MFELVHHASEVLELIVNFFNITEDWGLCLFYKLKSDHLIVLFLIHIICISFPYTPLTTFPNTISLLALTANITFLLMTLKEKCWTWIRGASVWFSFLPLSRCVAMGGNLAVLSFSFPIFQNGLSGMPLVTEHSTQGKSTTVLYY